MDFLYVFNFKSDLIENAVKRLKCSIRSIQNQGVKVIISDNSEYPIRSLIRDLGEVEYHHTWCPGPFNKPLMINYAVKEFVKSEYFFFSDIDLVYQKDYVKKMLQHKEGRTKPIRIVPYNYNIYQENYSSNYDELILLKKSEGGFAHGNGLIYKGSFLNINGLNEMLIGYGPEDDEFNQRIGKINDLIYAQNTITAHIYHPPLNRIQTKENSKIYHAVLARIKKPGVLLEDLKANIGQKYWGVISEKEESWKILAPEERALKYWERDKGEAELRIDYDLDKDSIVFDVGGYIGDWSERIYKKYNCNIFIFEPIPKFYSLILERFCDYKKFNMDVLFQEWIKTISKKIKNCSSVFDIKLELYESVFKKIYGSKLKIYKVGLSDVTEEKVIYLNKDSSSRFIENVNSEKIDIVEFMKFIKENNINNIDLLKLNVEGDEFLILNNILENKFISSIKNLQIQFHTCFPNAKEKRQKIRERLKKTHYLTLDYEWIWESWRLK